MTTERDQAYVEFLTAQLAALSRLALLLCGDPHRADDLVQQAVTKLYLRWHRADEIEPPSGAATSAEPAGGSETRPAPGRPGRQDAY